MAAASEIIRLDKLTKEYVMGEHVVAALREVELVINAGEFLAITGASGSGKSTLLHLIGCLDVPTSGSYTLSGQDVSGISDEELSAIRAGKLGFIFQSYNLVPQLSVLDNVLLPLRYSKQSGREGMERARSSIDRVGLSGRITHRPTQLSGGEMQRVAIARALINDPLIILADEPTGNLDRTNSDEIMSILNQLHQDGRTIVMATHNMDIAGLCSRMVRLEDGAVVENKLKEGPL
jgi:putative ABC transport system ATP-binding protein